MISYQKNELSDDSSVKILLDFSNSNNIIPSKNKPEFCDKSFKKYRVVQSEIFTNNKIEKSRNVHNTKFPCRIGLEKNKNSKQINILKVSDINYLSGNSYMDSLYNKKIERLKLKILPLTTCMKKINYDYERKNNLNSEISSNYKEMEIDNVFSDLLTKLKEKKDKNVEPKRFSELGFNNYVNKGPLMFFNLVVNRKISENQYSKAFLPCEKYRLFSRSFKDPMNNNISLSDDINKKIIDERNNVIKNDHNYRSNDLFKRSPEEMKSVNKNSISNSEKVFHPKIKNYSEKSEFVEKFESYNEQKKAMLEKSPILSGQNIVQNSKFLLNSDKQSENLEMKMNDEINMHNNNLKKEFQSFNPQLEANEIKGSEQIEFDKNYFRKSKLNLNSDILIKPFHSLEMADKNNYSNESLSNETTKSNTHDSPKKLLFCNIYPKQLINSKINIDRGNFNYYNFYI